MGEVKYLESGEVVCNPRFRIITPNWDERARLRIAEGKDFRITEIGKTDTDNRAGMYSMHSPLYGTDFQDENAFADLWSCKCGALQGRNYADGKTICKKCKSKVEFVDSDLTVTGWIILDRDYIIQSTMYKKIESFIGVKQLALMLNYADELEMKEIEHPVPYQGIGMIEFREKFDEIIEFFYKKNRKTQMYIYLKMMYVSDNIFMHCIPVYTTALRQFIIKGDDIKYSKTDTLFRKIFTNVSLLNDGFELQRRIEGRRKRQKDLSYLRRELILYRIQHDLDKLWDLSFDAIDKKDGLIKDQLEGGRMNYTARNVIIPDSDLRDNEISLGYTTFLEVYKPEMIGLMKQMYNVTFAKATRIWEDASMAFSQEVYELIQYMITHRQCIISVDRNPSINYGSDYAGKIVKVPPVFDNYCMGLPPGVVTIKPNADFDGDIMNIEIHKLNDIAFEVYKKTNPRDNFQISRNDGLYDKDACLFKDQIVGLYAFLNC